MTCREKLRQDHQDLNDGQLYNMLHSYCPFEFGINYPPNQVCKHSRCSECWDHEIPENEIKKENDIMPTYDISAREVTKEDLLKEIKLANEHIHQMKNQIKNLERYKQYEDMANEMKAMHTAFMNSGFSDEQAFDMLKLLTQNVIPGALRGMGL